MGSCRCPPRGSRSISDLNQLVPALVPHCHQITGVVWDASLRRDIRKGIFQDSLFPIQAVGTDHVPFPKPVSAALWPVDRSHRLSHPRFAIHPPAQFLRSVLVNNFDLIVITVVVRHVLLPSHFPPEAADCAVLYRSVMKPGPLKGRKEGEFQEDHAPKTKQDQVLLTY